MKIETHIVGFELRYCERCNLDFLTVNLPLSGFMVGDHVGVITELKWSEPSAYLIKKPELDSNQLCARKTMFS